MPIDDRDLLDAAVDVGLLEKDRKNAILQDANRFGRRPVDLASERLRIPQEAFFRALASERGLRFVEARELVPDPKGMAPFPSRLLARKQLLPIGHDGRRIAIATADPDEPTLETLRRLVDVPLDPVIACPDALADAITRATGTVSGPATPDAVALLDRLMREAYLRRASDIHLDPQPDGLHIRFRIHGHLQSSGNPLPPDEANPLLSRIKILAGLDIAERREPQDGGFGFELTTEETVPIDVRVATIPTRHGERATLRLLGVETRNLTLDELGFDPDDRARFEEELARRHGMILLTGPTGSGKTTTLYAAIRAIQEPDVNILTVEDPIEFVLEGISQIQVDRAGKVSFAGALRSLLRHDPDILMVGEIRDPETADVALKAAMTGHLVLSSLHTNHAVGAVTRLVDIGCEPYLVGATLRAVVAQRLVRRLCEGCRAAHPVTKEQKRRWPDDEPPDRLFQADGCPACMGSGFAGRLALAEGLWLDDDLAAAVSRGEPEPRLKNLALDKGLRSLREDGLLKAQKGLTTLEEVLLAGV